MLNESRTFSSGLVAALIPFALNGVAYACSYSVDPNNPTHDPLAERNYYGQYFFFATWTLLFLNIMLGFFSRKKYLMGVGMILLAVPLQLLIFLGLVIFGDSCGYLAHQGVKIESALLSILFLYQIALLIQSRWRIL